MIKAIFFDIDGTLITGNSKQITDETAQMLRRLSMHSSIFLATSLPYNTAMHKVSKVKDIIQGGVFAQGGMCRIFARKYKKVFPLETAKLGIIKENAGKNPTTTPHIQDHIKNQKHKHKKNFHQIIHIYYSYIFHFYI